MCMCVHVCVYYNLFTQVSFSKYLLTKINISTKMSKLQFTHHIWLGISGRFWILEKKNLLNSENRNLSFFWWRVVYGSMHCETSSVGMPSQDPGISWPAIPRKLHSSNLWHHRSNLCQSSQICKISWNFISFKSLCSNSQCWVIWRSSVRSQKLTC